MTDDATLDERAAIRAQGRCPDCGMVLERHGRAWVCPTARNEATVITQEQRREVLDTASKRVEVDGVLLPF